MSEYNYRCQNQECKKNFVVFAAIGTISIEKLRCPNCGSKLVKRVWFPVAVHYHGSGFTKGTKNE